MDKKLRVLILEDVPVDAELTERELRKSGMKFSSKRVETKDDFLQELHGFMPHIILADYSLPSFDGVSALKITREKMIDVPFIFVSGAIGEETAIETLKEGATDYVLKHRLARLPLAVKRALLEHEECAERKRAEKELRLLNEQLEHRVIERTKQLKAVNEKLEKEIIERSHVETALRKVNRALKTIASSNQALIEAKEETGLMDEICRIAVEVGGYSLAWVGFSEDNKEKTVHLVAQAGFEEGYLKKIKTTWADNEFGRGPTGKAIRTGKPCIVRNALTDPDCEPWRAEAVKCGYASLLALPLIFNGKTFGALNIYAAETDAFDLKEVQMLSELSSDLSYGIMTLRLREEQKKLEQQLIQSQKMEALGLIAGGIAHDFNNLLTAILGNAEFGLMKLKQSEPLYQILSEIQEAGQRAAILTRRLLAFSRRQVLQPREVNVAGILTDFSRTLVRLIGEDIELKKDVPRNLSNIYIDPGALEQIVMNLAVNARDAMPLGGTFAIKAQNIHLDEAFSRMLLDAKPGDYVKISIMDTGSGIDENNLQKIFEPFFTTKEKGTGLGLSIVYGIVKQHGGFITVSSQPDHGCRFEVYFPVCKKIPEDKKAEAPAKTIPGGTELILVADDEEQVRELIKTFLEKLNYKVILARDGEEAVQMFTGNRNKIDLVILDAIMPKLSGPKAYEKMRIIMPDLKCLFVTGYSDEISRKYFDGSLSIPFIYKPISFNDLGLRVRKILDKAEKNIVL
ncbi:MAG: response regulator [Firmicutes bacterium]|nr:response regulator [Bacillota bacterium]